MKKKLISYPSRIEAELIKRVNVLRKKEGLTWQGLTRKLLKIYLGLEK